MKIYYIGPIDHGDCSDRSRIARFRELFEENAVDGYYSRQALIAMKEKDSIQHLIVNHLNTLYATEEAARKRLGRDYYPCTIVLSGNKYHPKIEGE